MNLQETFGLATLRDSGHALNNRVRTESKTGTELSMQIWAESRDRGFTGTLGGCASAMAWKERWLPSGRFTLIRMPLNAAALSCQPKTSNLVLKKIHAREEMPIIVDYNSNQVGRTPSGYIPQVIVVDGKHRFAAAQLRGETHIMAWVGERVLHAMGSGGGGPAPERTTPAAGGRLIAKGKKLKELNVEDVQAGVDKHFKPHKHGGFSCRLCGDRVMHPRAGRAHLGKYHPELFNASKGDS